MEISRGVGVGFVPFGTLNPKSSIASSSLNPGPYSKVRE